MGVRASFVSTAFLNGNSRLRCSGSCHFAFMCREQASEEALEKNSHYFFFSPCFAAAFKYKIKVILTERIELLYRNI